MATQAAEVRSDRLVVLVSKAEKSALAERARTAGMTVSDFVRTAAEGYSEPSPAERDLMRELLHLLEEANAKTDASLARLKETEARAAAFDEDAYREQVRAELEARDDINWTAIAEELGLARAWVSGRTRSAPCNRRRCSNTRSIRR